MNMNLDDPKLTAYALDELSGAEKAEMETAVASSREAQEFVRELRLLSGNLRAEYAAERAEHPIAHRNICRWCKRMSRGAFRGGLRSRRRLRCAPVSARSRSGR